MQLIGSPAYFSTTSSFKEEIQANETFHWPSNVVIKNTTHQQGREFFVIEKSGIYDIFADICTDEPLQFTLFINGVPEPSTVFGRDSGANRCLMRQFVKLMKGDMIEIRNYSSYIGTVHTASNAGGNFIGKNSLFMAFLLYALHEEKPHSHPPSPKPHKPSRPALSNKK